MEEVINATVRNITSCDGKGDSAVPFSNLVQGSVDDIDTYFLMDSPFWPLSILAVYLLTVKVIGPYLMKNREPFDLKPIIIAYNLAIVIFSTWWLKNVVSSYAMFSTFKGKFLCGSVYSVPKEVAVTYNWYAYLYMVSKYIELLDTVFFVMRKKYNQVSFLHVYHHTNMSFFTWYLLKYTRDIMGGQSIVAGIVNTTVHIIMYTYYMLAAFGPGMQKYLWWKQYLTKLQIFQFLIVITFVASQFIAGCPIPLGFSIFFMCNTIGFLYLFLDFYKQSYKKPAKSVKSE